MWELLRGPHPAEAAVADIRVRLDRFEHALVRVQTVQEEILRSIASQGNRIEEIASVVAGLAEKPAQPPVVDAPPRQPYAQVDAPTPRGYVNALVAAVAAGALLGGGYWAYTVLLA